MHDTQSSRKTKGDTTTVSGFGIEEIITLEISKDKVRVQTAIVGVVVLVIFGVFLMLFLDNVYKIQVVRYGGSEPVLATAQQDVKPAKEVYYRP